MWGLQKEKKVSSGAMLIASFFLPRRREEVINNKKTTRTHQFPLGRQTEKRGDLIFSIFGTRKCGERRESTPLGKREGRIRHIASRSIKRKDGEKDWRKKENWWERRGGEEKKRVTRDFSFFFLVPIFVGGKLGLCFFLEGGGKKTGKL